MNQSPATQFIEKAIAEIQMLAQGLDDIKQNKLVTGLWDLEQKASALRSFILNKVIRKA